MSGWQNCTVLSTTQTKQLSSKWDIMDFFMKRSGLYDYFYDVGRYSSSRHYYNVFVVATICNENQELQCKIRVITPPPV